MNGKTENGIGIGIGGDCHEQLRIEIILNNRNADSPSVSSSITASETNPKQVGRPLKHRDDNVDVNSGGAKPSSASNTKLELELELETQAAAEQAYELCCFVSFSHLFSSKKQKQNEQSITTTTKMATTTTTNTNNNTTETNNNNINNTKVVKEPPAEAAATWASPKLDVVSLVPTTTTSSNNSNGTSTSKISKKKGKKPQPWYVMPLSLEDIASVAMTNNDQHPDEFDDVLVHFAGGADDNDNDHKNSTTTNDTSDAAFLFSRQEVMQDLNRTGKDEHSERVMEIVHFPTSLQNDCVLVV